MNVLYVTPEYPGFGTARGIATYTMNMAESMATMGHKVVVVVATITRKKAGLFLYNENLFVIGIFVPPRLRNIVFALKLCLVLPRLVKDYHVDLIESTDYAFPALFFSLIKKILFLSPANKVPVVVRFHGPSSLLSKYKPAKGFLSRVMSQIVWLLEYVNAIMADTLSFPTAFMKDEANLAFPKCKKKKQAIIPNGIVISDDVTLCESNFREPYTLLYVGGLSYRKGTDVLIRACSIALDIISDIKLVLIGNNEWGVSFDDLLEKMKVPKEKHCHFWYMGERYGEEKNEWFRKATLFVFLSRWENMPLVLLEAMVHGLPIICRDLPVLREIMTDKEAFFVDGESPEEVAKAIASLLRDPQKMASMGSSGKLRASMFDVMKVCKKLSDFYSNIIRKEGSKNVRA